MDAVQGHVGRDQKLTMAIILYVRLALVDIATCRACSLVHIFIQNDGRVGFFRRTGSRLRGGIAHLTYIPNFRRVGGIVPMKRAFSVPFFRPLQFIPGSERTFPHLASPTRKTLVLGSLFVLADVCRK